MDERYFQSHSVQTIASGKSRFYSRRKNSAIAAAVSLLFSLSAARAATPVWAEASPQTTERPDPVGAPQMSDASFPELVQAESYGPIEPLAPGEGPDAPLEPTPASDLDAALMGQSSEHGEGPDFWKPSINAGVTASVEFNDNIFITERDPESDAIFYASARVTLAFGNVDTWAARFIDTSPRALLDSQEVGGQNLIAVSYAPTAEFFANNDSLNTVNHDLAATVRWDFAKLRVAFDGRFQTLSDPDPDLGRRADRNVFNSHLQVNYDLTAKSVLEGNLDYENRDYDLGQDSSQVRGDLYAIYQGLPKTTFGAGLSVGQLELDGGNSQNFEQFLLRTSYNSYSKITATLVVGAELRQIESSDDQTNGVFEVGLSYEAAADTRFTVTASRRTEASATGDSQSIERTSFSLGYNQLLFQALTLSTTFDYSLAEYAEPQNDQSRTDHLYEFSASLVFQITKYGYARLGYIYTKNDSNLSLSSYDSNQVNLSFTALF